MVSTYETCLSKRRICCERQVFVVQRVRPDHELCKPHIRMIPEQNMATQKSLPMALGCTIELVDYLSLQIVTFRP